MDANRRSSIYRFADSIRKHFRVTEPVPDLQAFVERTLGGRIKFEKLPPGVDAKIQKVSSDSFEIVVETDSSDVRRRFSIAHELGHLFIHLGFKTKPYLWNKFTVFEDSVRYRRDKNEEEYEANEFAASFLMPEQEFRKVAQQNLKDGFYSTPAIAEHFQVSIPAAQNRGRWLGLFAWE